MASLTQFPPFHRHSFTILLFCAPLSPNTMLGGARPTPRRQMLLQRLRAEPINIVFGGGERGGRNSKKFAFAQQNHSDDDPPGLFILGMLLPRCLSRNRNDKMNVILCASFRQSVMQQIEKLPERKRAGREAGRGFRRAPRTTPPRRFLSNSTLSGSLCCMASHTS